MEFTCRLENLFCCRDPMRQSHSAVGVIRTDRARLLSLPDGLATAVRQATCQSVLKAPKRPTHTYVFKARAKAKCQIQGGKTPRRPTHLRLQSRPQKAAANSRGHVRRLGRRGADLRASGLPSGASADHRLRHRKSAARPEAPQKSQILKNPQATD